MQKGGSHCRCIMQNDVGGYLLGQLAPEAPAWSRASSFPSVHSESKRWKEPHSPSSNPASPSGRVKRPSLPHLFWSANSVDVDEGVCDPHTIICRLVGG
jgi:hypothetical protein